MRKIFCALCAALLAATTLIGCATVTPVSTIVFATPAGSSAKVVRQGIIDAARENNWSLKENGQQSFLISRSNGDFTATSRIDYTANQYEITYVTSSLKSEDGKVPQAYNDWVTELNKAIQNAIIKLRNPAVAKSNTPQKITPKAKARKPKK